MTDLWQAPFRPFFLLAGIAAVAGALPWAFPGATDDPVGLHARAFLQVWVGFAAAGYLLTAAPHWTGRPPLCGARLPLLAFLGGAAGVAAFALPDGAARFVHLVFCAGLGLALRGPMAAGRRVIALAPWGLGALPFLLDPAGQVLVVTALIALIGGAAVPGFCLPPGARLPVADLEPCPACGHSDRRGTAGTALPIAAALLVTVGACKCCALHSGCPCNTGIARH
ncbi:NnrS family protein [Gemmobacter lanyuensis]